MFFKALLAGGVGISNFLREFFAWCVEILHHLVQ